MKTLDQNKMERLFEEWKATYPKARQRDFQKDGIIDRQKYNHQKYKLLFVMLEPNSTRWPNKRFRGMDLRIIYGQMAPNKGLTRNLSLWARGILENNYKYNVLNKEEISRYLKKVAVLNLKKLGGTSKADLAAVSILCWKDRAYIKRQIALIKANIIIACGETTNRLLYWIMKNNMFMIVPEDIWYAGKIKIFPANHPSLRPRSNEIKALKRINKLSKRVLVN